MTFDELFHKVALSEGLTISQTKRVINATFDEIKVAALGGDRVGIPQFGVFLRRTTKASERPVGGVLKKVAASSRVVFRASTGAKVSE